MIRKMVLITACGNKKEEKPTIAGKLYSPELNPVKRFR
ncbi:hypothetical protein SAMN06264868_1384 [Venenivibrio stagnispumantis]|uniref:Uncharacterized protein n=1 Tax=Venenivibrio stagnispumantis TaxID=407998 RepID=A0AA45WQD7_9AQUI|nr:hypothetical protein SAMN06264868_1384 [Venenivibrio stagnispumantis]